MSPLLIYKEFYEDVEYKDTELIDKTRNFQARTISDLQERNKLIYKVKVPNTGSPNFHCQY